MSKLLLTLGDGPITTVGMVFPDAKIKESIEVGYKIAGKVTAPLIGHSLGALLEHGTKISEGVSKWAWGGQAVSGIIKIYDDHLEFTPKAQLGIQIYDGFQAISIDYQDLLDIQVVREKMVYVFVDIKLREGACRLSLLTSKKSHQVVDLIRQFLT